MDTAQTTFVVVLCGGTESDRMCMRDRSGITVYDITGCCITRNEREIISRVLSVFPAFSPELLWILGTINGILNPTNRSPSDI
jgi:hypothetical protein